ncbi:MAG: CHAT domain-containing protein [Leptolyngbyaceae cyanobacterium SL_5_9]|nr:CHAT domain-containing protein [Leptolyngbyaceae cyanobacterium SL_5_9]
MDRIKVLFLAADPSDRARLRLGQELRDIREKLQLARRREKFFLESRGSVRSEDITQAIFDVEPQIVHFSGHGENTGELCFEDVLGSTQSVRPNALASLFELVPEVNCVILNTCYSEAQAKAIAKHIPCVIGMSRDIGDKAAIAFAVGFYKALGAGQSFENAYKFACVEIQLKGLLEEHLTPVLHLKKAKKRIKIKYAPRRTIINSSSKNLPSPDDFDPPQEDFIASLSTEPEISEVKNCETHLKPEQLLEPEQLPEIDFSHLHSLLNQKKWQDADLETHRLLLKVSQTDHLYQLNVQTLEQIPDDILKTLDDLWSQSSEGKFGFSVQHQIYRKCLEKSGALNYSLLGEKLGWKTKEGWQVHQIPSRLSQGHFPKPPRWFNRKNTIKGCFIPPLAISLLLFVLFLILEQSSIVLGLVLLAGPLVALLSFIIHTSNYLEGLEWMNCLVAKLEGDRQPNN